MAENAVDNGVELRIRRQVTAVKTDDKEYMELKVRHWEPKQYLESLQKSSTAHHGAGLDLIKLGAVGGILSAIAFASGQVDTRYLPIAVGVTLGMFLYQVVVGSLQGRQRSSAHVKKSTPLKDLVAQAGVIHGRPGDGNNKAVTVEEMKVGGSGSPSVQEGVPVGDEETIKAKYVLNCAGSASDQIAAMIGDTSFKIKPRLGDYLLLNRNQGHLAKHTLFPCPDPVLGKGVLVQVSHSLFLLRV